MYDLTYYETRLSAHVNRKLAIQRHRESPTLRGTVGVPYSELTKIISESEWAELPQDEEMIKALYSQSLEEGLISISLLSVCVLSTPAVALELANSWVPYLDDVQTADALGHLVIGPASLSLGLDLNERIKQSKDGSPYSRRAEVMSLMAALPEPIHGPAAAGLREYLNAEVVTFVEDPYDKVVGNGLLLVLRDNSPIVRKSFSSVLRAWTACSKDAVDEWVMQSVPDRHPWVKDGLKRGIRERNRRQRKLTNDN